MSHDKEMTGCSDPPFIQIPALDFDSCRRKKDPFPPFLLAAVGVVIVYVVLSKQSLKNPLSQTAYAASMVSNFLESVSARLATAIVSADPADSLTDASSVYTGVASGVKLANAGETNPKAYQTMSDVVKEGNQKNIEAFLKAKDKVVIMLFAPWCEHCHTSMPLLKDCASKYPTLMIDAETVPRSMVDGTPGSLFKLEYFPTFMIKTGGTYKNVSSPAQGVEQLSDTSAGIASFTQEESEASSFDHLF